MYRLTLIGENDLVEMGIVVTMEGPISVADLLLLSITCLQNLYYAAIYLIPTTLEIVKISLLFPCREPVTIEIPSATTGLFCGTVYPLIGHAKSPDYLSETFNF